MVFQARPVPFPPHGGNRSESPFPPWWYVLYPPRGVFGSPTSSAAADARDVDFLLLPLVPSAQLTSLIDEINALAVVDASVQAACELIAEELQPALDEDDDGVLTQVLWINARESLTPLAVPAIRCLLRGGLALLETTRAQLAGPMRSSVLRQAGTQLRNRREHEPIVDERLKAAEQEIAAALPEQIAAAVAVGLIILAEAAIAIEVADYVYSSSHHGHHIWDDFHS